MKKKLLLLLCLVSKLYTQNTVILLADNPELGSLLEKLCESSEIKKIYLATNSYSSHFHHEKIEYLLLSNRDIYSISQFATQENVDLVIVNHWTALQNGIINLLNHLSSPCFGAHQEIISLESSYETSRIFFQECGIPCIPYTVCTSKEEAKKILHNHSYPLIIKTDMMIHTQKKSPIILTEHEALLWLNQYIHNSTDDTIIIIEDVFEGEICDLMIMTDGTNILPLLYSNKETIVFRNLLNTKPLFFEQHKDRKLIISSIIEPLLRGLKNKFNITYKGVLHVSCSIVNNTPIPIHFTFKFKNPDTAYLMNHIKTDFFTLLQSTVNETIGNQTIEWDHRSNIEIILDKIS